MDPEAPEDGALQQLMPGTYIRAVFNFNGEFKTILFELVAYELAMAGGMPVFADVAKNHKLAYIPK